MSSLLAKSPRGGRALSLHQHLLDTEQAASLLFREGTRWGATYLRFFKLAASDHSRFLLHLRVAALFHDLGKANEGFQNAMRPGPFVAQPLRHEHLSALVLAHPAVQRWLGGSPELDQDVILAAVLSHHLKAARDGTWEVLSSKTAAKVTLLFDDVQVTQTLTTIANIASVPGAAPRLPGSYQEQDELWAEAYDALFDRADRFGAALGRAAARRALCLAVKAGVIVADSVASAMVREQLKIPTWIDEVAHAAALEPDEVRRDVLCPRIDEITRARGGRAFSYHPFQDGAAAIGPRGLLLAACGTGKTMAAWRWADAIARTRPIGRVVFLYPTRGTATEGFRDYVGHAPEGTAALVHGTSRYELEGMQANPAERPASLRDKDVGPDESEARLFALGLWPKRYFSATVDQFLSFMEHGYRGLCLLPALADAAVIFDEIHSYDTNMWNALVAFLREFDVPVLCMTATLPPARQDDLANLLRSYPDEGERAALVDLEAAERHPRYHIEAVADEAAAFEAVVAAAEPGVRILWVVNTVRRCQNLALRLQTRLQRDVLVYHSRYKLEDRQKRHRAAVDAFRAPEGGQAPGAIAVTTQVCEMSLDLDADILVTEHAPISALVQRFGRANRHLRRGDAFRARLVTYAAENPLPYEREELDAARSFLAAFEGRDVSQRQLADGLIEHSPPGTLARGASRFLEGGFFATPGPLRDSDDSGASVILDTDVAAYQGLIAQGRSTDGLRLPVPRKLARPGPHPGLPVWLGLSDGARYHPWLGFLVDDELTGPAVRHGGP
ncbi:MAG TPA: CRISPR-associated helicase Cas3' [Kofleriaceae bacterium]|nr:CRISPR-associated helicase Cas3' [Kofleriaceae bacterium]